MTDPGLTAPLIHVVDDDVDFQAAVSRAVARGRLRSALLCERGRVSRRRIRRSTRMRSPRRAHAGTERPRAAGRARPDDVAPADRLHERLQRHSDDGAGDPGGRRGFPRQADSAGYAAWGRSQCAHARRRRAQRTRAGERLARPPRTPFPRANSRFSSASSRAS